jgi:hypothetical protein
MTTRHPQVEVYFPLYEKSIQVDEELAPLLSALWAQEIWTMTSCQEIERRPQFAYLQFFNPELFERFFFYLTDRMKTDPWIEPLLWGGRFNMNLWPVHTEGLDFLTIHFTFPRANILQLTQVFVHAQPPALPTGRLKGGHRRL